jgi:alpha-galactosidase
MKMNLCLIFVIATCAYATLAQPITEAIIIQTVHTSLVFTVNKKGELKQAYFGKRLAEN